MVDIVIKIKLFILDRGYFCVCLIGDVDFVRW